MIFFFLRSFFLFAAILFLDGCAPASLTLPSDEGLVADKQKTDRSSTAFNSDTRETSDLEKLADLWQRRTQEGSIVDYPIGPGDVLEISVPAMKELTSRTVRVSGEGTISLPFIGLVRASGLPEKELREEIRRRLQENYMYDPQVNLFVREYRSRQVAVLGAVGKPGLYSLASGADTLLDMISQAGGMTEKAAPRINFIPAEPAENGKAKEIVFTLPAQLNDKDASPHIVKTVDPIVIDFVSLTKGGNQTYLALPVRPGDVIMVPGGGEVMIQGWIAKPGSYRITPRLTVLGVVAAAGGSLFPADSSSVKIMRTSKKGEKKFFFANLEAIERGEKPDIPVQEGDVIEVSSTRPKLVAYGFYRFFTTIFRIGAHARVPLY